MYLDARNGFYIQTQPQKQTNYCIAQMNNTLTEAATTLRRTVELALNPRHTSHSSLEHLLPHLHTELSALLV